MTLSLNGLLLSQSSYEIIMEDHPGGLIRNVLSKDNGEFFFPITEMTTDNFSRFYDTYYYEIDESGQLSEIIVDFDIDLYHLFHMRPWKDGLLFDVEFTLPNDLSFPADDSPYKRCILEIDNNFQIVDSLCFISNGRHYGKAVLDEDNTYRFVCNERLYSSNILYGTYTDEGLLLDRFDLSHTTFYPTGLARASNEKDLLLFSSNGVIQVKESFELVDILHEKFKGNRIHGHLLNLDGGDIALTGVNGLFYEENGATHLHYLVTIRIFDSNYEQIWSDTMGIIPEDLTESGAFNYPAMDGALDTLGGNLFFAGINRIIGSPLTSNVENSFFIAKYNQKTGEVLWKYDQINPEFHNIIYGVKATPDGGCLLYGFIIDPETSIRYPYLLKLDENGLLSTSTTPEEDTTFRFTLYGNPSSELKFNVNSHDNWKGRFKLINASGQVVMQDIVQNGFYTGNTSRIPTGLYIVVLSDASGRVLSQQKWLKQ